MAETGTGTRANEPAAEVLAAFSPRVFRVFIAYLEGYFARNFDAVRILKPGLSNLPADRPVIFITNHCAWWDPIMLLLLSSRCTPGRRGFGPMDAEALKKYGFMKRIGIFGVERDSQRGAARFLKIAKGILAERNTALWLTPQGEFMDTRMRPVTFKPGVAHLARDLECTIVPMAMEFPFWDEPKPEALVHFGEPIDTGKSEACDADSWNAQLQTALEETMDELATAAMTRDPGLFDTAVAGKKRVSPVYDAWRYLKAAFRGEKFSAAHKSD